ncbi:MAG: BamA/TamA family outer membrane protein [Deltaproteobacteria bacterium]|nr:BamA/TamA family outer membrane protein [Deltaproteobacteria bacterium]
MRRRAGWTTWLLLGLTACSGGGLPRRSIVNAQVLGNRQVDGDELMEGIANRPPSGLIFETEADFRPLELQLDQRRIETTYKERGFFSAKVLEADVVSLSEDEVTITYRVDEGAPSILESVRVEGGVDEPELDDRSLALLAGLELGEPVDYRAYLAGAERIKARLFRRGYAYVAVESRLEIDRDRASANVIYSVDSGPIAYFGKITIEGLERVDESLVLNRLNFTTGDRFDPDQLERTRQRINLTGLLGDVRYTWDRTARTPILDLTVRASEGLRHEVRLGAGFGVQRLFYEVRGRLGYAHRSFLDGKSTLRAEVKPGLALLPNGGFVGWNVDAEAALDREDFIWPLLRATVALQYALTEIPAYSHQGPTARFTVGRLFLDDRLTASIGTQYRFQSFLRIEPEVEEIAGNIGLDNPLSFFSLEPTVTYDGRDDPSATTRGVYLRLRFELGRVLSGDARSYLKLLPEVRGYFPLSSRIVAAARARVGARLLGLGSLPVTQRLFAGGPESQRGFGRQRLSPFVVEADGDLIPVGGEVSLELNAEVRIGLFPVLSRLLSLVVFLDGADVTERLSELEATRLHYALGGGLRYDTPVGPVRADIGFRLNRTGGNEPDPNDRFALHLSLGEAF